MLIQRTNPKPPWIPLWGSQFSTLTVVTGRWLWTQNVSQRLPSSLCLGSTSWNVMPFRLKNAQMTLQRLIEIFLGELRGSICFVYIDDIIIQSTSMAEQFLTLPTVHHQLQTAGLTINLIESKFYLQEITFLSHVLYTQIRSKPPIRILWHTTS